MKTFKSFDSAQKPLVKKFVNTTICGNAAVNHKGVEAFYYYILDDSKNAYDAYIYFQTTSGKGRFTSAMKDTSVDILPILDMMNVKYSIGNNAPKGGKKGDYILISSDERKRITTLYNEFINK